MLKQLQKYFAGSPANPALAEQEKEVINMTTETEANAQAAAATIAELTASLEQATATLAQKDSAFAEMSAKLEQITAALSAAEAAKLEAASHAKSVVTASRKEKLEAVLGTVGAAPVLASLEDADDTTFNTVLSAFSANREAEGKSKMFQESGVAASVEFPAEEADTASRLAAKIAAQYKSANAE